MYSVKRPHKGDFPNCYWDSQRVPLYGADEVKCFLRVYPSGKATTGYTSIYLHFERELNEQTSYFEADISIYINKTQKEDKAIIGDPDAAVVLKVVPFGKAYGWLKFCPITEVFIEEAIEVGFTLTIKKIVITPIGERMHDLTTLDLTKS